MYDLIVFLPLLGFLIAGIFGRWIGARPSELVTTVLLGVSFLLAWVAFFQVAGGADTHVPVANWFVSGKLSVAWALRHRHADRGDVGRRDDRVVRGPRLFDRLHGRRPVPAALLRLPVALHVRDVDAGDIRQFGPDVLSDGRASALMSYLLVGFWYERPSANAAAIKAFVVNRVGDFGFSLGIFLTYVSDQVGHLRPGVRRRARSRRQDGAFRRHRLGRGHACLSAALHGRDGQVGAVPAAHLAA